MRRAATSLLRASVAAPARAAAPSLLRRNLHASATTGFMVRSFEDVQKAGDVVKGKRGSWESRRYYKRKDGLGFSFHHTILFKGKSTLIWYRNHVEAVMIIKGSGEIELVNENQKEGEGKVIKLKPFDCYALNGQERHFLRASPDEDMEVICAFNPPVAGTEDHNDQGVFPAVLDDGKALFKVTPNDFPSVYKPPESLKHGSG